jgi:hypothetical protein
MRRWDEHEDFCQPRPFTGWDLAAGLLAVFGMGALFGAIMAMLVMRNA